MTAPAPQPKPLQLAHHTHHQRAAPLRLRVAGDRLRVLDIEEQPFLLEEDLAAQLGLFSRLIWYTDADTLSSGALELAREAGEGLEDSEENRRYWPFYLQKVRSQRKPRR